MTSKNSKRARAKVFKEMMDSVERGHAFTVRHENEPVAIILPWETWLTMNHELARLSDSGVEVTPAPPEVPATPAGGPVEARHKWWKAID